MNIGQRIKQLREQANLTQTDVGDFLGVTKATVARYENGEIDIKRTAAIKLAKILNTTPAYIMGWSDTPKTAPDLGELSGDEKALVLSYRSHPEMRAAINKMLDIEAGADFSISNDVAKDLKQVSAIKINTSLK